MEIIVEQEILKCCRNLIFSFKNICSQIFRNISYLSHVVCQHETRTQASPLVICSSVWGLWRGNVGSKKLGEARRYLKFDLITLPIDRFI